MTNKELRATFQKIKNERRGGAPHEGWVKQNRDILLMQVRNTTDVNAKPGLGEYVRHLFDIFVPVDSMMMTARALGVFLLVVGTVFGGGIASAQIYRGAAPGEAFYRVKVAVERVQIMLAPNDEYKTRLHTEFADRRIDEVAKLAERSQDRHALVAGVLASFDSEILALQSGLETLKKNDPEGVVEMAKLMERKMASYQSALRKAGALVTADAHVAVIASRDLVDGLTIKAMAVIVEKHLAGDSDAPRAVVVGKFEERIRQAEAKVETAVTPKASQVKAAIAEAKELVKEEKYEAALSKMVEVAELTKEAEAEAEAVTPPAAETESAPAPSDTEEGTPPPPAQPAP